MNKWVLFASLLMLHWAQAAPEDQDSSKPVASSDKIKDDLQTGVGNLFRGNSSDERGIFHCDDSGCEEEGGSCTKNLFAICKYKANALCKGLICTCCVPCSGECGSSDDGICKAKCGSDEHAIDTNGKCGNNLCKCCKKSPVCSGSCGVRGTCKERCDPVSDDKISGVCSTAGCSCCEPKPPCNERCGWRNKFFCRSKYTCNLLQRRPGRCEGDHCVCCSK